MSAMFILTFLFNLIKRSQFEVQSNKVQHTFTALFPFLLLYMSTSLRLSHIISQIQFKPPSNSILIGCRVDFFNPVIQ